MHIVQLVFMSLLSQLNAIFWPHYEESVKMTISFHYAFNSNQVLK